MNPQYKVQIDVTLVAAHKANNIQLRLVRYVPFVPREGDTIRLTGDDDETTMDVTVGALFLDTRSNIFIVEIEDHTLQQAYYEQGNTMNVNPAKDYIKVGFSRLNYPVAQAIRA